MKQPCDLELAISVMERRLAYICQGAGSLSGGLERINAAGGKRLRPTLAWICWRLAGAKNRIVPLMCMLELMHTASIIHDDLVDNALFRRGTVTISAKEGAQAAVQSGDYLLSRAMELLETYRGTGINEYLSRVSEIMSLGELKQQENLYNTAALSQEKYFDYINAKTAVFIAESCRCGALAASNDGDICDSLYNFGLSLGRVFQMKDDYTDLKIGEEGAKPKLSDLENGVITLPMIIACEKYGDILKLLLSKREKSEIEISYIAELLENSGALETTAEYIRREGKAAAEALDSLPDSLEKHALTLLAAEISEV